MLFLRTFKKISMLLVLTTVLSCAKKTSTDDLKDTQMCLNSAPASEAMACIDKISSDQSPQAYKLRCAAVFIAQGFGSPTSFIDALDQINNNSGSCTGGCSTTVGAVASLTFKNTNNSSSTEWTRTNAIADQAFSYCSQAATNIYMQISSLFKIGTYAANLAYQANGGGAISETDVRNAIASIPDSTMGSLAVSTYDSTCQDTTSASDAIKKYCLELGNAVNAGGSQSAIGACLKNRLADPTYTCP